MSKFRAWDDEEKCWVQPGLIAITGDGHLLSYDTVADQFVTEVLDLLVSRNTGLLDKNGKEIYSGDIVKKVYMGTAVGVVEYHAPEYKIRSIKSGCYFYLSALSECLEVIGNIYESPELMVPPHR